MSAYENFKYTIVLLILLISKITLLVETCNRIVKKIKLHVLTIFIL